ncbi:hypothetical protein OCK74_04350 [Chitinophagaceae bacterium LB-8]|uniref:Aromatic hydrocarbon degradation protein n=1 Tax=Paraflavisolibacter caeni TaxID=2982496 RepID=A0A9X3B6P6_9BACT|nr:hypothetical protein [Paraflavisolibacter caeni]MCU7548330.1 hypothetical protein [Paraflavisolibacter caeni]
MKFVPYFTYTAIAAILLLNSSQSLAQSMSTPYSVYGVGDIDPRTYNHNIGMGSTGLALKTTLFSSGNNPASVAGMQRSFFMLETNGTFKSVGYSGKAITNDNKSNSDFTIKKLSLSTKLNSVWASGIGFKQYSSVNYQFQTTKPIEGSEQNYLIQYSGDGGLNSYYWNNAFALGKNLSLGVTSSFLSGSVNQTETITESSGNVVQSLRKDYYKQFHFDYGLIYTAAISKKWNLALGGRFAQQTKLNKERSLTVIANSDSLISQDVIQTSSFSLPQSYGAGIAFYNKTGTTTFAADYSHDNWTSLNYKGSGWKLVNSDRFSVGAEFASFKQTLNKTAQKRSFQLGAFINNSYLQVKNYQINDYGITAGLTRSLNNGLLYTIGAEAGTRGTINSNLIKENYVQLSLTLSFRDYLFSKGRKYD